MTWSNPAPVRGLEKHCCDDGRTSGVPGCMHTKTEFWTAPHSDKSVAEYYKYLQNLPDPYMAKHLAAMGITELKDFVFAKQGNLAL